MHRSPSRLLAAMHPFFVRRISDPPHSFSHTSCHSSCQRRGIYCFKMPLHIKMCARVWYMPGNEGIMVRPPLARLAVHVVIRSASWSSSRSFHPQHENSKLTMELSTPLKVSAGSCSLCKSRYCPPSQVTQSDTIWV